MYSSHSRVAPGLLRDDHVRVFTKVCVRDEVLAQRDGGSPAARKAFQDLVSMCNEQYAHVKYTRNFYLSTTLSRLSLVVVHFCGLSKYEYELRLFGQTWYWSFPTAVSVDSGSCTTSAATTTTTTSFNEEAMERNARQISWTVWYLRLLIKPEKKLPHAIPLFLGKSRLTRHPQP